MDTMMFAHLCFVVGSVAWFVVVVIGATKELDVRAYFDLVAAVAFLVGSVAMLVPAKSQGIGKKM